MLVLMWPLMCRGLPTFLQQVPPTRLMLLPACLLKIALAILFFSDFIERDSLIEGPGTFEFSDAFVLELSLTVADGDFEEYFLIVDAFGFAEEAQQRK